jgi:hypothetical protein
MDGIAETSTEVALWTLKFPQFTVDPCFLDASTDFLSEVERYELPVYARSDEMTGMTMLALVLSAARRGGCAPLAQEGLMTM